MMEGAKTVAHHTQKLAQHGAHWFITNVDGKVCPWFTGGTFCSELWWLSSAIGLFLCLIGTISSSLYIGRYNKYKDEIDNIDKHTNGKLDLASGQWGYNVACVFFYVVAAVLICVYLVGHQEELKRVKKAMSSSDALPVRTTAPAAA